MKDKDGRRVERSRLAAYGLCVLMVAMGSIILGVIGAASVEPGDEIESTGQVATRYVSAMPLHKRDELIEKMFFIFILPALLGVRSALGPKPKV